MSSCNLSSPNVNKYIDFDTAVPYRHGKRGRETLELIDPELLPVGMRTIIHISTAIGRQNSQYTCNRMYCNYIAIVLHSHCFHMYIVLAIFV